MDALEVVMTILHAGGKFGGAGYKVASGLHGVGVTAVNALQRMAGGDVRRDGRKYRQRYERGKPAGKVQDVRRVLKDDPFQHGTVQHFHARRRKSSKAGLTTSSRRWRSASARWPSSRAG